MTVPTNDTDHTATTRITISISTRDCLARGASVVELAIGARKLGYSDEGQSVS